MSREAVTGRQSFSPPDSGRSTPIPRTTRKTVEGDLYKADKSLRRYAANIERALSSWEISPEEWADYIAFLGRLLKAIQNHPKDAPVLPHSDAIATRLAQCLNPALPSGVHQKSLEVYTYIFSAFGNDFLAGLLHEYLPGLTAVLSFASLSVRPGLYSLYEDHIISLPPLSLRPALKSLTLSLLPALEDETGEDFDRAFRILQSLEHAFTSDLNTDQDVDGYFWQCLFLAVVTSPTRRQGALNYLVRKLPKLPPKSTKGGREDEQTRRGAETIVSPEPGLLIRCFVCGLSDSQILIQRGFLDLLVTHLPLSCDVLQQRVGNADLDRLVTATTLVLLRRDMSLNRRLWSWFLGPEPKEEINDSRTSSPEAHHKDSHTSSANTQLRYFSSYGKSSLQRCILAMLQDHGQSKPAQRARPFRVCLSLMDRWEIGGLLVPDIFLPAMRSLYEYSLSAPSSDVTEVVRSASLFFDGVEASLIWECLLGIVRDTMSGSSPSLNGIELFRWIVGTFNVKDEEMLTVHIPIAMLYLLAYATGSPQSPKAKLQLVGAALQLLNMVPARVLQAGDSGVTNTPSETLVPDATVQDAIRDFYRDADRGGERRPPFGNAEISRQLSLRIASVLTDSCTALDMDLYSESAALFLGLLSRTSHSRPKKPQLRDTLIGAFEIAARERRILPFPVISWTISLTAALSSPPSYLTLGDIVRVQPLLTSQLWEYMSPSMPKYHVEAVKAFWQLEKLVDSGDAMTATLATLMRDMPPTMEQSQDGSAEAIRRFTVLWRHSVLSPNTATGGGRKSSSISIITDAKQAARHLDILEHPLVLVLDALASPTNPTFEVARNWLQSVASLEHVFQILLRRLNECSTAIASLESADTRSQKRDQDGLLRELDYIFHHFENLLEHGSQWTWRCLSSSFTLNEAKTDEKDGLQVLAEKCVALLCSDRHPSESLNRRLIAVLDLLISGPVSEQLKALQLEVALLDRLMSCIKGSMSTLQGGMLRVTHLALKLRLSTTSLGDQTGEPQRASSSTRKPLVIASSQAATSASSLPQNLGPPPSLFKCLQLGFASSRTRNHLDQWLQFLADVLPMFADAIFANLLPLVECFCKELLKAHGEMVAISRKESTASATASESVIMSLLEGLEMVLDRAYQCLMVESADEPATKEADTKPGFFGNVAAGMFKAEGPPSRTSQANSRLTVILTFQDSIRVALKMWLWASSAADSLHFDPSSSATTSYNALKVRNKTRHLLEEIFSIEPLESLEVVMKHWCTMTEDSEASATLSVLHVMQVTRPKNVVPAVLDALCSRTNAITLPAPRQSSLTTDLSPSDVAIFLTAYLASIEDDAMDEVWPDCLTFLRDVLSNPLPHRQVLPHLLAIILLLSDKLNNTNFGEQKKMRRELGDIFQRLLAATFTTLPSGYVTEPVLQEDAKGDRASRHATLEHSMTLLPVLIQVTDRLDLILETQERIATTINTITGSLISSIFRARSFPKNVGKDVLTLLVNMARKAPGAKPWKKEISDAFNDTKILSAPPELMTTGWFPAFHQWSLHDRERMPELLSRLTPPSIAGIMFGVGASAARLEADRKTQLNLRRICLLLLASPEDTYVANLRPLEEKLAELFDATPSSSPSSAIKAELFMLCRTLTVSVSPFHLAPLWPVINDKLQSALLSLLPTAKNEPQGFNNLSLFQACKLLDTLVAVSPDEFQLHEWLYISDTIDAVYQPSDFVPAALSDHLSGALASSGIDDTLLATTSNSNVAGLSPREAQRGRRWLLLGDDLNVDKDDIKALPREEFVAQVIRPFLSQLSIHAYEGVYSLDEVDGEALRRNLLGDLLDGGSVAICVALVSVAAHLQAHSLQAQLQKGVQVCVCFLALPYPLCLQFQLRHSNTFQHTSFRPILHQVPRLCPQPDRNKTTTSPTKPLPRANMPLTDIDNSRLAAAFACMETEPKIDFEKFRIITGLKSVASARECLRVTKNKLKAEYGGDVANGGAVTPVKKARATPSGTPTPKRARAAATPKGKKAKAETEAPIKDEDGDEEEAQEPARKKSKSKSHEVEGAANDSDDFVL
ncbi:unnamed protein product [Zymoseptoria tritici ST99CH_3D1]|nr:unnamed protein product [Zymoseptoria tritici ST99CH_3D1]